MLSTPKPIQITNAHLSGWEYLGDGIFTKNGVLGYFLEAGGFYTEL